MGPFIFRACPWDDARPGVLRGESAFLKSYIGLSLPTVFRQAGLLGHKNTTSIIAQVMGGLAMLTLLWVLVGYSMAFSGTGAVIGNLDAVFMSGVSYT